MIARKSPRYFTAIVRFEDVYTMIGVSPLHRQTAQGNSFRSDMGVPLRGRAFVLRIEPRVRVSRPFGLQSLTQALPGQQIGARFKVSTDVPAAKNGHPVQDHRPLARVHRQPGGFACLIKPMFPCAQNRIAASHGAPNKALGLGAHATPRPLFVQGG